MNDLEQAIAIALDAHEDDTDKAGETYIRHPLRLMTQMDTEQERIVAVLHDVVEDSGYGLQDIEREFGIDIRQAVEIMTKSHEENYLEEYIPKVASNDIARKVKKADLKDNLNVLRLSEIDEETTDRLQKYHSAYQQLDEQTSSQS